MIMNICFDISKRSVFADFDSFFSLISRLNRPRGFQQARADLEAADVKGRSTALHAAARAGNLGSAEALLRRRWDLKAFQGEKRCLLVSFEAF